MVIASGSLMLVMLVIKWRNGHVGRLCILCNVSCGMTLHAQCVCAWGKFVKYMQDMYMHMYMYMCIYVHVYVYVSV